MEPGLSDSRSLSPVVALEGKEFRKRYLRLVIATWTLPVLAGTLFEMFVGMVTAKEVLLTLFAGFSGPFVAAFLVFATIILDRRTRVIVGLVEALPQRPAAEAEIKVAVRWTLTSHIGLFLLFNIIGPQTTLLTDYFLYPDSSSNTTSLGLLIGILAPILLIALPLFFLVTDTLGRYLAPHGVMFDLAPLRLKYLALGLITPALVDVTLLLYFYDRTGFFHAETLIVWLGLLIVAGLGTALAWRSLGQSLTPLKEGLAGKGTSGDGADRPLITPQSLDELGLLALDWNRAAEKDRLQKARYRDLVQGSIQGIFIVQNMRIVFANSAFVKMMGFESTQEVLDLPDAMSFVAHEDRGRVTGYAVARREGREAPERYEVRAIRADGSLVWQDVISRPVEWDGAPALQITVVDITDRKRAEESLRASEARFRELIEGSIQGILIHRHHEIIFANQALADMLRYRSAAEVIALKDVLKFVHDADQESLVAYRDQRMAGQEVPSRYEFRVVGKDGATIWVENVARLVDWDGDKAIQSTFVDISDRKRAEESLRESEARFRDLIEGSIQGIFVHQDFRLLFANHAMAEIMGYESVPEFLALGSLLELIPAEDRAKAEEIKTARMEGKDMPERYELRAVRRDGSAVWLENVARIVNWDGEPAIQATVVDVTERKLAEEAVRRSEDSLRRAQHIAKIGNWERDFNKGELYWSDEMYELFGLDRRSVTPSHDLFMKYVHPDDEAALRDNIDQAVAGEAPYDIDFRVIRPNGEQIVVHAQGEIDRDIDGQPVYFRGTAQDVTKLREAEAQVRLLNEELEERVERRTQELRDAQAELIKKQRLATLGQLTATVSHELRNPLGAMRTSVFVLEKNLPAGSDGMQRALARIERGIQRCDRIVDELLDYTRSTTITKESIDVDRWLAGVLSEQPFPEGVEIRTDLQLGDLAVMMDPERMRRAVINVVENACQAMTGEPGRKGSAVKGRVTVASKKVDGNIEIRIDDNGPGMSAETREKIFEPLFSTKNFGVGLGLPTVQKILEQHGGHVLLESEPGVGTVFHLVFPLEKAGRCRPGTIGDVLPADIEES